MPDMFMGPPTEPVAEAAPMPTNLAAHRAAWSASLEEESPAGEAERAFSYIEALEAENKTLRSQVAELRGRHGWQTGVGADGRLLPTGGREVSWFDPPMRDGFYDQETALIAVVEFWIKGGPSHSDDLPFGPYKRQLEAVESGVEMLKSGRWQWFTIEQRLVLP